MRRGRDRIGIAAGIHLRPGERPRVDLELGLQDIRGGIRGIVLAGLHARQQDLGGRGEPEAREGHAGIGCDHLLESMHAAGPSVLGLDWRTPIGEAHTRLGDELCVQGNLDPALVLAGTDVALAAADAVLADNDGHAGHVFNLGHGVNPATDPDVLAAVVRHVHERTAR